MMMTTRVTAAAVMLGAVLAPIASAQADKAGSIAIEGPWSRETAPGARTGAGYMTITNKGEQDDRLLSGSTPVADRLEIHTMTMDGGVMRMRPLKDGLAVPAGGMAELKPGGYHIMLIGLKAPLKKGSSYPVVLNFMRAGQVKVSMKVESISTGAPSNAQKAGGHDRQH